MLFNMYKYLDGTNIIITFAKVILKTIFLP